jgi:hypothetical protein
LAPKNKRNAKLLHKVSYSLRLPGLPTFDQHRKALASEVSTVQPARLLTLLGQALKWQQQQGLVQPDAAFDLFRGQTQGVKAEDDAVPTKQYSMIKVN